ncbi:Penicillin-insensitive transglycosylase & transpeptidase PBP-1C (plasmid) [Klebsiella aerogenes]|nr:Penicillin-insensitive transglycosylase & transpeptidase PBP-1C [Klebsiella aerogenes]
MKSPPARVVVAEDGTPLWRFADAQGVWRYPVTIADVSPRYLQALIQYEDRWFWKHPGVNPFAVLRAAWQDLTSGRVISGGSTLTMQVARLLDPHPRTFGGKLRQLWRGAAAGVASVKKRNSYPVSEPRAVWRHPAGDRRG